MKQKEKIKKAENKKNKPKSNKNKLLKISLITIIILTIITFTYNFLQPFIESYDLNSKEMTELKVQNNTLYMNNLINSKTPNQIKNIFKLNPQIDTIIMQNVPGSVDDEANLEIATWLSKKNLTTILTKNSQIASGGTDFFLLGKTRIIYNGAEIGVHSWGSEPGEKKATEYEKTSDVHKPYLEYYKKIGWDKKQSEKFYFFTLQAAPAEDIYIMTNQEILNYNMTTENKIRE